ncbi:cytochrome P450 71A26 [Citrus sinensis]|uniref:Cytochrome P450 71A26 n=1 Tax=Citrus sinensis TaxID=2711 RepID=A0ACB8MCV0_CITSI|nr:cytochrome P450 71A26 [Citrus sinensis]
MMEPLFWFAVATIFFIVALFKWYIFKPINKNLLPPSPPKLPIIGNLHQIGSHPHRSLDALAQRYGPLTLLHFGKVRVLVVSSADAARQILKTHDLIFANRPKLTPLEKLFYGSKDVATSPYVNLSEVLYTLTNDVLCTVALGRKYSAGGEGVSKFRKLLGEAMELMGGFYVGDYISWLGWVCNFNGFNAKLEKTAKGIDDFLDGVVEEHEKRMSNCGEVEDDHHQDFVDVLLGIQKENTLGFPIDRVSIKAIIFNMFGAGTDTTYTLLEWAMTELLRHPKIMKEVQNEIREIVGDKSNVTEDDLDKFHYLKAVFKETLRIHPPIPILLPRQSTQDVKINGYDIPEGTQVYINYATIAKDRASWDQADEFRPERFLVNPSINFLGKDLQFIPFGAGRRICPGIEFTMRVNELALASLLNKFDWSQPCEEREEAMDITESTGATKHKKSPLIALATPYSR